jgi:hypothetical protein
MLSDEMILLFLKGTSGHSPWNGFERLVRSIDKYRQGGGKASLWVFGKRVVGELPERDYIRHFGLCSKEELDQWMDKAHCGVATLALYRKGLEEASSLKVREYMARGLPFFYAYSDPDLDHLGGAYAFKVPNDDSLIDLFQIKKSLEAVYLDTSHPSRMHELAAKHMDYAVKMAQLKTHLMTLKSKGNP